MWYLCSVPNWVKIYALVTEIALVYSDFMDMLRRLISCRIIIIIIIDALMLQTFI